MKNSWMSRNLVTGLFFISPWIIGFFLFSLYPVAASFYFSLTDYSVLSSPVFIGERNYVDLAHDQLFWKAISNTLFLASFSIPLNTFLACFLAVLLNFDIRFRSVFRTLFFLPSLVPMVCLALIWQWLLNGEVGLINSILSPLIDLFNNSLNTPWTAPAWLEDAAFTKPGLILAGMWGVGHAMVIYLAGLQEAPVELYEAAAIDGAGFWRKLWHVTLPQLSPYIFFNMIMGLIGSFQVFAVPYVMMNGGDGPERSLLFVATYIYQNAFDYWNMGYACAIALVLFLIIFGLTLAVIRMAENRVYYGGR